MTINIEQGNLFSLPKDEYVFAHCIAADLKWCGGIAPVLIKKEYDSEKECRYIEDDGTVDAPLEIGDILPVAAEKGVFVNLITKESTWDKPTYQDLEESLVNLKDFMETSGFDKLAMPKIGCGIDGLEWDVVEPMIEEVFEGTDIDIEIRYM